MKTFYLKECDYLVDGLLGTDHGSNGSNGPSTLVTGGEGHQALLGTGSKLHAKIFGI